MDPLSRRDLLVGMLRALFLALFGWMLPKRRLVPPVNGDFRQLPYPIIIGRGVPIGFVMPEPPNDAPFSRYLYQLDSVDVVDSTRIHGVRQLVTISEPTPNWRFPDGDLRWTIRES